MTFAGKEREKARQLSETDCLCCCSCCCCIRCNECHMPRVFKCTFHAGPRAGPIFSDRPRYSVHAGTKRRERERERERELSPISATGGNRPIWRQVELMRSRLLVTRVAHITVPHAYTLTSSRVCVTCATFP